MMATANNGSFDHLIVQLDSRLSRIEHAIDRLIDETAAKHEKLHARVQQLEHTNAKVSGGWSVLTVVGTVSGVVGGIATKWIGG